MPAYGRKAHSFVEARHSEYLACWNFKLLGKLPYSILGDPIQLVLQIQKQLDQESFFPIVFLNYIIQLLLISIDHEATSWGLFF